MSVFSLQLEKALCVVCLVTSDTLVPHVDISINYELSNMHTSERLLVQLKGSRKTESDIILESPA